MSHFYTNKIYENHIHFNQNTFLHDLLQLQLSILGLYGIANIFNSLEFILGIILNINTMYLNITLFDIHLDKNTIMGQ